MRFTPTPPLLLLRRLVRSVEENGVRGAIAHSYQRLFRVLHNHGLGGTFERAFRKAPTSSVAPTNKPPHPFDLDHGTDTGGYISGADLPSVSLSALYITAYLGISPSALVQALLHLPFKPEDFAFVDLGCGKGRALIVASQFPFRRLVGVEIATDLCRVATNNIALQPDWAARISILNQDATAVTFPDGPLLIFLFHPFLSPVLRRVLANLEQQLRRSPRETWLLYARNPRYTDVLEKFTFLHEVWDVACPLSPHDAAADYFNLTEEHFTLYHANLNP